VPNREKYLANVKGEKEYIFEKLKKI